MMKLSYNVFTKADALWVRVFKVKNRIKEDMPVCIKRSRSSLCENPLLKYGL